MQPPVEAALAQHVGNVLWRSQQRPCFFKVTAEIQRGHDSRRQHFRIAHRALRVFAMSQRLQYVGTNAVNRYNLFVHGSLPSSYWLAPLTLKESPWTFHYLR